MPAEPALAEGMQNLGEELMAFSQKAVERNVETTMKVLSASSVEEVMDLQTRHAMGSMDQMMTGKRQADRNGNRSRQQGRVALHALLEPNDMRSNHHMSNRLSLVEIEQQEVEPTSNHPDLAR